MLIDCGSGVSTDIKKPSEVNPRSFSYSTIDVITTLQLLDNSDKYYCQENLRFKFNIFEDSSVQLDCYE